MKGLGFVSFYLGECELDRDRELHREHGERERECERELSRDRDVDGLLLFLVSSPTESPSLETEILGEGVLRSNFSMGSVGINDSELSLGSFIVVNFIPLSS